MINIPNSLPNGQSFLPSLTVIDTSLPSIHVPTDLENYFNSLPAISREDFYLFQEKIRQEADSIFSYIRPINTEFGNIQDYPLEASLTNVEATLTYEPFSSHSLENSDKELGIEKRFHPIKKRRVKNTWTVQELTNLCKVIIELYKEVLQFQRSLNDNNVSQTTYRYIKLDSQEGYKKNWRVIIANINTFPTNKQRNYKSVINQINYIKTWINNDNNQKNLDENSVWSQIDQILFKKFKEALSSLF